MTNHKKGSPDLPSQNQGVGAYPRPSSVKGRVLASLLTGAELTHLDCWRRYGSARLAHPDSRAADAYL